MTRNTQVLRYIVECETLRHAVHTVFSTMHLQIVRTTCLSVSRSTIYLKTCVLPVLVSHVPKYILELCVLRVLVSHVLQ
jgi:hypothetical protein